MGSTRELRSAVLGVSLTACLLSTAAADTHYVATNGLHVAPFTNWVDAATNIQAAVDEAAAGDTVLVSHGSYRSGGNPAPGQTLSNRVCITTAVQVVSLSGWEETSIVGSIDTNAAVGTNAVRCAYVSGDGVLSGFTLTNGHTLDYTDGRPNWHGGGAYVNGGTLTNCYILNCSAISGGGAMIISGLVDRCYFIGNLAYDGGGLYCQSNSLARHCEVRTNVASGAGGGIVCVWDSTIEDSTVRDCSVVTSGQYGSGGGGYCGPGSTMRWCTFENNYSDDTGGGITISRGSVLDTTCRSNEAPLGGGIAVSEFGILSNCVITANNVGVAEVSGGGVWIDGGATLVSCTISSNTPAYPAWGGGINIQPPYWGDSVQILDCNIRANCATRGGGIHAYIRDWPLLMERCRISDNVAEETSGGLYTLRLGAGPIAQLTDSLVCGNAAPECGGVFVDALHVRSCTIAGNVGADAVGGLWLSSGSVVNTIIWSNQAPSDANWSALADDAFTNCCTLPAAGFGAITNAPDIMDPAGGDYRLSAGSPCIDAGTNVATLSAADLLGYSRTVDGDWDGADIVDIGCHEYNPAVTDTDGDGATDSDERSADTDPTDGDAVLRITGISPIGMLMAIQWKGGVQSTQTLETTDSLGILSNAWHAIFTNLPPTHTWTNFIDTTPPERTRFYRVTIP